MLPDAGPFQICLHSLLTRRQAGIKKKLQFPEAEVEPTSEAGPKLTCGNDKLKEYRQYTRAAATQQEEPKESLMRVRD